MGRQEHRPAGVKRSQESKRMVFRRTLFLMLVCGVLSFVALTVRLWDIAILHHEEYQKLASDQQLMDVSVAAHRGNILDRNGNVMAMSATVYKLILAPKDLIASVNPKKFPDELSYQAEIQRKRQEVVDGLCALHPEMDRAKLEARMEKTNSQYEVLMTQIEEEDAQAIRAFIQEHNTSYYLYLTPDTKRYYPYSALASQVLGFVNTSGGAYGLEAGYEEVLKGLPGRVVTGKTAKNVEMYHSYSNYIDAIDGYNLTLTLDATIQSYAEQALEKAIQMYDVRNGGFCVVMDPKTGALLAMASSPEFDPNQYAAVSDSILQKGMEEKIPIYYQELEQENRQKPADEQESQEQLQTKARQKAMSRARELQWRNKIIREPYEPGSTFKALVLAAALEEGVVSEQDTFDCPGYYMVAGERIHCSKRTGHGHQTLTEAVQNSCNPAFIMIGQRLKLERFYQYFEAFGMTSTTQVDLPGEEKGIYWAKEDMGIVDLAVASFGQRFTVNPLQLITGFAAVINGGALYQPYVVQSITDGKGAVIQKVEPTMLRQVVSQESSQRSRAILESVVSQGTGKNAYQAGYRIGGKTGSSETTEEGRTIVSFAGFAPADDPKVVVLFALDKPQEAFPGSNFCTTGTYISGGNMAAPHAGQLIAQILDYMGVAKEYTSEESGSMQVTMPHVTGLSLDQATGRLKEKNLRYRTIGTGDTVTGQVPGSNAAVPGDSTVVLYLGGAVPEPMGTVPHVVGLSYEEAKAKLEEAGFFLQSQGSGQGAKAQSQSVEPGKVIPLGTIVSVQFSNVVEDGYAGLD